MVKKGTVIIVSFIFTIFIMSSGYGWWREELTIRGDINVEIDPEYIAAQEALQQQILAELEMVEDNLPDINQGPSVEENNVEGESEETMPKGLEEQKDFNEELEEELEIDSTQQAGNQEDAITEKEEAVIEDVKSNNEPEGIGDLEGSNNSEDINEDTNTAEDSDNSNQDIEEPQGEEPSAVEETVKVEESQNKSATVDNELDSSLESNEDRADNNSMNNNSEGETNKKEERDGKDTAITNEN